MAVKAHELDNRERGLRLDNRGGAASSPAEELKAVRARIAAAKATTPQLGDFARGWQSAIRAIEGEG